MLTADANGSPLILATDPDADRLALAEKIPATNKWKIFSGNELGALLSWWAFKNYKERHPNFDGMRCMLIGCTACEHKCRAIMYYMCVGLKWLCMCFIVIIILLVYKVIVYMWLQCVVRMHEVCVTTVILASYVCNYSLEYAQLMWLSNAAGSKVHMLASTVSSKFIRSLGNIEGFQFEVCSNTHVYA